MRKKLRAAGEALEHGVERVVIGSAAVSDLLAGSTGTLITKAPGGAATSGADA